MTKRSPSRGFTRAMTLIEPRLRKAGSDRGFAVSRMLTHWADIVGPDLATITTPVKVGHDRRAMGATLTVLTTGANGPMVDMQAPQIRDKVNACYGYNAIARVRVTQTAATGFAEGQALFTPAPSPRTSAPCAQDMARAAETTTPVQDDALRAALTALGANVMTRSKDRSPT